MDTTGAPPADPTPGDPTPGDPTVDPPADPPRTTAPAADSDGSGGSGYDIVLLERVALGARVQPAIAVGLALGAIVWLTLSATSWIGLRFFLASLAAVVGAVTVWIVTLNRSRPDRSVVRPADLPVRLEVDDRGIHLLEDRGPSESIVWSAPHAIAVWTDPTGRPLCLRVASEEVTWTLVGGLDESGAEGLPAVTLGPVASAYARASALARRHAPWEVMLSIGAGHDVVARIDRARSATAAATTPLWRVPLDAEFDPTARWALRLTPGALVLEHGGEPEDRLALDAPLDVTVTWIEAAVLPGTPPRVLRRFDVHQDDAHVRFAIDPGAMQAGSGPVQASGQTFPRTDQPRLVPPDWAPVVLAFLGLEADGRTAEGRAAEDRSDA